LDLGPATPPWRFPVPDLIVEGRRVLEQYINEKGVLELKKKSNSGTVESKAISGFVIEIATLFDEQKNLDAIRLLFAR